MDLTIDQIKASLYGVAGTEFVDGTLRLYRFTEEQMRMYQARSPENYYRKTFDTSGVFLEFETDSRSFGLSVEVARGYVKDFFVHSVYADDVRIGELSGVFKEGENLRTCSGEYTLPEGMKRVKVYFPWNAASRIVAVTLDDGAVVTPVQKDRKLLLFGDSITQGYFAMQPENSYASQLVRHLNANAISKAIGGEVFWPELAATRDNAIDPDTIFVAYGSNDWQRSAKQAFEADSRTFFANLRRNYPDAKIYALAPIWRADLDTEVDMGAISNVAKHFRKIAEELGGITVIDCIDFLPHVESVFLDGFLHPSDAGFAYYGENLIRAVDAHEKC